MLKRFLKDSALFTLVAVADKGLNSITFLILGSYLSTGDYGRLDLTTAVLMCTAVVAGMELYQGVLRLFSEEQCEGGRSELVSTAFWAVSVLGLLVCGLLEVSADLLGRLLYGGEEHAVLLRLGGVWLVLYLVGNLLSVALRARLKASRVAAASALKLVVQVGTSFWLIVQCGWKIEGVLLAQCMGMAVGAAWCLVGVTDILACKWSPPACWKLLSFSTPLVASSLCVLGGQYGDRLIVRGLLTIEDVGLLGTGYRLANVVSLMSSGVMMALSPMIYQSHHIEGTAGEIARLFRYYVVGGVLLAILVAVAGGPLLELALPEQYYPAAQIAPLLVVSLLATQSIYFFPGLVLAKRMRIFAAIQVLGLGMNLGLCWLLGGRFGVLGVCLAGIIAQCGGCMAYAACGHRDYPIPVEWQKVGPLLLWGGLLIGLWTVLGLRDWPSRLILTGLGVAAIVGTRAVSAGEVTACWAGLSKAIGVRKLRMV